MSQTYQDATRAYAAQLRNLFTPSEETTTEETRRSATGVSAEVLAERAEALVETSQTVGEMTTDYLAAATMTQREAAEMKLLAQAIAELEASQALLDAAEAESKRKGTEQTATRRAGVAVSTQTSLEEQASILEAPLDAGIELLLTEATRRAASELPTDPDAAKAMLQKTVEMSLKSICRDTSKVGAQSVNNLLLTDAAVLRQGIAFVSQDAAELLDQMMAGLGGLILRLVQAAIRLLAQAYKWVRSLLGQDLEQEARQQVGDWLGDLKQESQNPDEGLFRKLINKIYGADAVQTEIQGWVQATQADLNQLTQAIEGVDTLPKRYQVKAKQVERLLTAMAFVRRVPVLKTPQGQVIVAAVTLGVLSYVLYIGHDHIRDGRIVLNERFSFNIPDRIVGVRETVQRSLGIA